MLSFRLLIHIARISPSIGVLLSSLIILSRLLSAGGLGRVLVLVVGSWLRLLVDVLLDVGFHALCGGLVDAEVFAEKGGGGEETGGGRNAEGASGSCERKHGGVSRRYWFMCLLWFFGRSSVLRLWR